MVRTLVLGAALSACSPSTVDIPVSGYVWVPVPTDVDPADVVSVEVGGVPVAEVRPAEGGLEVLVQGAPTGGVADARVRTRAGGEVLVRRVLRYVQPEHPALERVISVGASVSMGVQSGAPTRHGQLHAPSLQVARAFGAHHPIPLLKEGIFPPMTVDMVGPPPACQVPSLGDFAASAGLKLVQNLRDPETGVASYRVARSTPEVAPWNLAVAGSRVGDLERGANADDLVQAIAAGFVLDLDARFGVAPTVRQLDVMDALSPSMILSADLYGNDIIAGILQTSEINPDNMTPEAQLVADIDTVVDRLAATGAQVFVPNLPDPTLLPGAITAREAEIAAARARAVEAGADPDEAAVEAARQIDLRLAAILERWRLADDTIRAAAARHDQVYVVDVAAVTEQLRLDPPVLAGQSLGLGRFEGLLSLDGLHFTDVGYGYVAQAFIDRITEELGIEAVPVDLEVLAASDPHGPAALAAAGLRDCE